MYVLARVSEGEAFAHRLLGMCACMPVVCFSRASSSVLPMAMYVSPKYACEVLFGLSLHTRGGETRALIRLFYPSTRY